LKLVVVALASITLYFKSCDRRPFYELEAVLCCGVAAQFLIASAAK